MKKIATLDALDKLAAKVEKFVNNISAPSDTTVAGTKITIGDTEPTDGSIWFDTSAYASIQGATPNISFTIKPGIYIGDTQQTDGSIWIDTSVDFKLNGGK